VLGGHLPGDIQGMVYRQGHGNVNGSSEYEPVAITVMAVSR
jgi:hypothetical protein